MKYFITSDIHSFYKPLMDALKEAGYDQNNPDHILVVNGDLFDRGPGTVELLSFVKSLPKEKRILIRGNHEYLLRDILEKDVPESYDYSNGTVKTCYDLYIDRYPKSRIKELMIQMAKDDYMDAYNGEEFWKDTCNFNNEARWVLDPVRWGYIKKYIKSTGIIDWIFGDEWVNYLEIDKYIITHSFIPLYNFHGSFSDFSRYEPNWRNCATPKQWIEATWGCPYHEVEDGYFDEEKKNGKILVCGHWHASDFHQRYERPELWCDIYHMPRPMFEIFYGQDMIALDACTVLSGMCNVLVINDSDMSIYDQHGNTLTEELSKSRTLSLIK